jgi:hypothetical protein
MERERRRLFGGEDMAPEKDKSEGAAARAQVDQKGQLQEYD